MILKAVGLKIEIHEIHEIHQNFTKSSVNINQIPASVTKCTYMKRKLSKSNVSTHESIVLLTKSTLSHAFNRQHSTRMLKFKLEATSISSTVRVRQRDNVGG